MLLITLLVKGNVSHFCPAMHGVFFIESGGAVNHTPAVAAAAGTEGGAFVGAVDCSKGLRAAVGFNVLADSKRAAAVLVDFTHLKHFHQSGRRCSRIRQRNSDSRAGEIDRLLASPPSSPETLLKIPGAYHKRTTGHGRSDGSRCFLRCKLERIVIDLRQRSYNHGNRGSSIHLGMGCLELKFTGI
jgi:hypothetical protein